MQASSCQPGAQSELAVDENTGGRAKADPFSQGAKDFRDTGGRGFEAIQDCAGADTELGVTGPTP